MFAGHAASLARNGSDCGVALDDASKETVAATVTGAVAAMLAFQALLKP